PTATARSMHQVRMHTHKSVGDAAGRNSRHRRMKLSDKLSTMDHAESEKYRNPRWHADQSREARLARKRAYNKKYRALTARGLTGAAKVTALHNERQAKRDYYLRQKDRYAALGLNSHGRPWKTAPALRRKMQLAQTKMREREWKLRQKAAKRLQFIYPVPPETQDPFDIGNTASASEMEPTGATGTTPERPHFCPRCGEELAAWKR